MLGLVRVVSQYFGHPRSFPFLIRAKLKQTPEKIQLPEVPHPNGGPVYAAPGGGRAISTVGAHGGGVNNRQVAK